jgi:hypothetical protein
MSANNSFKAMESVVRSARSSEVGKLGACELAYRMAANNV